MPVPALGTGLMCALQGEALKPSGAPAPQAPASQRSKPRPRSCDTFVALPPATADGSVVFGKNSDRETEEVQEVVAYAGEEHAAGATVACTYITIPQALRTYSVVLSKPTWMWGAEMGANEHGVVCGNEAVWTVEDSDGPPALLGMDLVRLGLERAATAEEAVEVMTALLEEHGQGGPCEEGGSWTYHNSFLAADARGAWVLETAGRCWAAQRVTQGVRNISNCLSIRTAFDRCSAGLRDHARQRGYWDGCGQFDWAAAFSDGGAPPLGQLTLGREANGYKLLQQAGGGGELSPQDMIHILRDSGSGICMCGGGGFRSNGAQVSWLPREGAAQHWFTATPDPQRSVFKPFAFASTTASSSSSMGGGEGGGGSPLDGSPHTAALPATRNPPHALWRAWQSVYERRSSGGGDGSSAGGGMRPPKSALRDLEARGLDPSGGLTFAAAVEEEMRLYGAHTQAAQT